MAKDKKRAPRKGAKKQKSSPRKRTKNVKEFASLSCTRTLQVPSTGNPVVNTLYSLMNTSLDQFPRAVNVATAFQHYRINYIQVRFKPDADTFAPVVGGSTNKPMLYYMIDKAGALPTNITLEGLKQMGAKPRDFDEKDVTIGWRPSVLEVAMTAGGGALVGGQAAKYRISPWLSTSDTAVFQPWNASTVDHLGLYWFVAASQQGGAQPLAYQIEVEVQFEFKKPLVTGSTGDHTAIGAILAIENRSADGIVGGVDGV